MQYFSTIAIPLAITLLSTPALAAECTAKSGAHTVPLLELYTSEGCSSCPPADEWMSKLKNDKVTPLAFHVDYWDYIGWKDKFSKADYSNRQRKLAAFAGVGFVYTPQFVMSGRDFRGWDDARLNQAIEKSQKIASRAELSLAAESMANGEITLKANARSVNPNEAKNLDVFIALYENKLTSQVNAGENNGRVLKHDYVVREFFGAYSINHQNQFSKHFNLNKSWRNKDAGAVIFVQNSLTGEIIQSVALSFCSG